MKPEERLEEALNTLRISENSAKEDEDKARALLKRVRDPLIIETVGMADMPLIAFLLSIKYNKKPKLKAADPNDLRIFFGLRSYMRMSYLAVYIHFLTVEDGMVTIEGNTSYPSVVGECEFVAKVNGSLHEVKTEDCGLDLMLGKYIYEKREVYKIQVPLSDEITISFYNKLGKTEVPYARINTMRFCPVADCIEGQYFYKDGHIFHIEGNALICKKAGQAEAEEAEARYREGMKRFMPENYDWACNLREKYFEFKRKQNKPVWVFMDRPEGADDNARALFEYLEQRKDIDSYFILSKESPDYEELAKVGNVVDVYSKEHYQLALIADCIISSQCNGIVENPFWDKAELFRDLYHRPAIIFLQHGVILHNMSPTLNRFHTNFTGFITSTKAEQQSILEYPYYYSEKEVWLEGLCRFDKLKDKKEKYILLMPTWRKGLTQHTWNEEENNMRWDVSPDFADSEYIKRYTSLIHNEHLLKACKEKGYKIAFKAHPLFREYFELLLDKQVCEIWGDDVPYREAFGRAALMITDYSSTAFDFAFLQKPLVYYHFDKEEFFAQHTVREGYFDYDKDGMGEVCHEEEELVDVIVSYIKKDCELKEPYISRMESMFPYNNSFCERTYKHIIEATR